MGGGRSDPAATGAGTVLDRLGEWAQRAASLVGAADEVGRRHGDDRGPVDHDRDRRLRGGCHPMPPPAQSAPSATSPAAGAGAGQVTFAAGAGVRVAGGTGTKVCEWGGLRGGGTRVIAVGHHGLTAGWCAGSALVVGTAMSSTHRRVRCVRRGGLSMFGGASDVDGSRASTGDGSPPSDPTSSPASRGRSSRGGRGGRRFRMCLPPPQFGSTPRIRSRRCPWGTSRIRGICRRTGCACGCARLR